jgi:hypothetical protein
MVRENPPPGSSLFNHSVNVCDLPYKSVYSYNPEQAHQIKQSSAGIIKALEPDKQGLV